MTVIVVTVVDVTVLVTSIVVTVIVVTVVDVTVLVTSIVVIFIVVTVIVEIFSIFYILYFSFSWDSNIPFRKYWILYNYDIIIVVLFSSWGI